MKTDWAKLKEQNVVLHDATRPYWTGFDTDGNERFRYGVRTDDMKKLIAWKAEQAELTAAVRAEAEDKEAQREKDRAAGMARLVEYTKINGGLEDTRANSDHIRQWLEKNVKGYISPENIDVCIQCLGPKGTNVLTWATPAPPPPPAPPQEELGTCADGEPQLSLHTTTDSDLRRASKAQVADYIQRKRDADGVKYNRPEGYVSGRF